MKRSAWQAGFTLVELVIVLVLVGILSAYIIALNTNSSALTARSQADKLASDIRHAQSLAMTWSQPLQFNISATGYSIRCTSTTAGSPCNNTPSTGGTVTDPATNAAFQNTLGSGVSFAARPTAFTINTTGIPTVTGNSFQLSGGGTSFTVTVATGTGNITVTSP
ncbi:MULTISPECIES: prepilin-type N-terminal cleavage/methylation domain-containing protein [Ramlibacter]|uniref:Type II secretion system protein H n=1 Tax=Ramlibacter aquaticus TaxID=2780094 RepID=A0ABR9SAB8_9BURK|nr:MULTISPECIES: prepilin-type N-terminal cleavage/methylation domain-containing protein [Ramlibacter]MBE7939291.1 prepilin-type N-terminal cleavage/methylation domain-containing protein [Ramlibacter aquaticus]